MNMVYNMPTIKITTFILKTNKIQSERGAQNRVNIK